MDEGGGDDDARAKVLGKEEDPFRHLQPLVSPRKDGKHGT